jgi:hypothetical protein
VASHARPLGRGVRAQRGARRRQPVGDAGDRHGEPAGEVGARGVVAAARGVAHALADVGHPPRELELGVREVGVDDRAVRDPDRRRERRVRELDRRRVEIGDDLAQLHGLEVAALAAGRDAQDRQPRRDVLGGDVVAVRAGAPSLEQVARQEPDVGAQLRDVERRRLGGGRAGLRRARAARAHGEQEGGTRHARILAKRARQDPGSRSNLRRRRRADRACRAARRGREPACYSHAPGAGHLREHDAARSP